ncbi:PAS domain-containing protein [Dongia sp.]|uniref:PAS domain-containing protein n=1 Tax=Dongia sp. TaxID=1977262 RepID=UPI0035B20BBE
MIDRNDIRSSHVLAGYDYWLAKRRALADPSLLPHRRDFDPLIEMPRLAPRLMLMDVRRDPLDFRYRLVGTALRRHMATDWTGRWLSDIPFQRPGSTVWENNLAVIRTRSPLLARPPYIGPHRDFLFVESIILPLAGDDQEVDMLMFAVDFIGAAEMASHAPSTADLVKK